MCDIYSHKCEKCNTEVEMHLGDFNTTPDEIQVYCRKHIMEGKRSVTWKSKIFGEVIVVALTDNAWENRDMNHPNDGYCEKVHEST